jgi:hypothetical protein
MKIELDHQELQSILEHIKQAKAESARLSTELLHVAGPRIMDMIVETVQRPRVVPDLPQAKPAATGTDDA